MEEVRSLSGCGSPGPRGLRQELAAGIWLYQISGFFQGLKKRKGRFEAALFCNKLNIRQLQSYLQDEDTFLFTNRKRMRIRSGSSYLYIADGENFAAI